MARAGLPPAWPGQPCAAPAPKDEGIIKQIHLPALRKAPAAGASPRKPPWGGYAKQGSRCGFLLLWVRPKGANWCFSNLLCRAERGQCHRKAHSHRVPAWSVLPGGRPDPATSGEPTSQMKIRFPSPVLRAVLSRHLPVSMSALKTSRVRQPAPGWLCSAQVGSRREMEPSRKHHKSHPETRWVC